jgi:hypothetical protein
VIEWGSVFECALEILSDVWGDRLFIKPILSKVFRLSLQLEGRCRMAAIPRVFNQVALPESHVYGENVLKGMERINSFTRKQFQSHVIKSPRLESVGLGTIFDY